MAKRLKAQRRWGGRVLGGVGLAGGEGIGGHGGVGGRGKRLGRTGWKS